MGFIGSLFGGDSGNSGGAGMNYQATGPTQDQINSSWANTQNGLGMQNQFINALQAQGGIGNQSNVFAQQQALAGQLGQQAQGFGPNPAQAQFQQNANQVAAQTAGLIGSQKGMSPALQARLVAQQGAGAGQAAAGQAATLQAQQQLGAQQALMQQQANMANLSTQQVGQQQNALNSYIGGAGNQYASTLGLQGNSNSSNAGVSGVTAGNQGKIFGGLLGGAGSAMGLAHGGTVPGYDMGGVIMPASPYSQTGPAGGPQSLMGKAFSGMDAGMNGPAQNQDPLTQGAGEFSKGLVGLIKGNGGGGNNIDMSSPLGDYAPGGTDIYQSSNIAPNLMNLHGGMNGMDFAAPTESGFASSLMSQPIGMAMSTGGVIQGENYARKMKPVPGRAKVSGDSEKNDTKPAMLSPGEIIIPRTIAEHPNAPEMAARFVAAIRAKQGRGIG